MRLQTKTCRKKNKSVREKVLYFLTVITVISNNLTLGKSQKQNNFKPICHLFLFNFHFKLLFELKADFQRSLFSLHLIKRMIFKMEKKTPHTCKNLWNASAIALSSHPLLVIAVLFKYT